MAVRLQTEAWNIHNELFQISLLDSEYAGDPIIVDGSGKGWTLKYDGDTDNRLSPILASEARYFIRVNEDNLADIESVATDLLSCAEGRFTLKIMRSNGAPLPTFELFWVGYVLQDLSQFSDEQKYEFTFAATDGLGRLKSIEYKDTSGLNYQPFGNLTMLEHLLFCLNQDTLSTDYFGGADIFLRTCINWQDGNMSTPTATKCPLAHTRVQGFVFAERVESDDPDYEWKYKSCYDVVRLICEHWAARIYFSSGCYRIEQPGERDQDVFFERRFSKSGSLLSSAANAAYDKDISQNFVGARLATGVFSYLPPLKQVEVSYEHLTFRNYLSVNGNYWYYNSPFVNVTLQPIAVDADTFFRVSGSIYMDVELIDDYANVGWWRHVMGLQIFIAGQSLNSDTTAVTGPGGNLIPVISRNPLEPEWAAAPSAENYEISSAFAADSRITETVTFAFDTPVAPSGTSIQISFTSLGSRRLDGTSEATTMHDWRVITPIFGILNNGEDSTFFEKKRLYQVLNQNTGNSHIITYKSIFGSAIKGWTEPKLQTSPDGLTWSDTTNTWHYGSGVTSLEFGKLLATEIMAGQIFPLQRYSGTIFANQAYAHSRFIFADDSAWLMLSIEYSGREGIWQGDWFRAGSNRSSVTQGPTVKLGDGKSGGKNDPPGFVAINPGSTSSATGTAGLPLGGDLAINIMAINYLGANVGSGMITSIPLQYASEGNCLFAGDVLNIYNPTTGQIVDVTVAANVDAGDTSISIESTSLTNDLLTGSLIFLGLVNHYTGQGGGGGNMPPGTSGQILVHNGNNWEPYSGTADGNVLTWDSVNGWQEESPTIGGGGTVTSVGLSMPAFFSVTGSPVTGSGTLAAALVSQGANLILAGPATGSAAAPAFRTLVSADLPASGVTFAKIQNIATQRVIGRNTASSGSPEEVTAAQILDWLGATQGSILYRNASTWVLLAPGASGQLLQTGGAGSNPAWATIAAVTGSGLANYVAIWSGSNTLTYDTSNFLYDSINKRLGVGTSSPQASLHGGVPTGSSGAGLYISGNISGNLTNTITNVNNANAGANVLLTIAAGGSSGGDSILQLQAGSTWALGVDNSDADAFVIAQSSQPGTANKVRVATNGAVSIGTTTETAKLNVAGAGTTSATFSLQVYNSASSNVMSIRDDRRVGILTTAPGYELDVSGATRSNVFFATSSAPSVTLGAGAGSGSGGAISTVFGSRNGAYIAFTTGSSVSANATVIQVTPTQSFPTLILPTFSAANAQTATDIAKFYVSTSGNSSFIITSSGSLSTSTQYQFYFTFFGY